VTAETVRRPLPGSRLLNRAGDTLRAAASQPAGAFGLGVVVILFVLAIFPTQIAPYAANHQDIVRRLQGPSSAHLLGTDELGRDTLSRLIFGTRIALEVAVPAIAAALLGGLILGLAAGYVGGWVDNVLIVIMDTLQSFPAVILALALISVLGPSIRNIIIVIAVAFIPNYARVSRALVLSAKQNQWVEAERSLGARASRIILVHILPNIAPSLFVLMAMDIPSAITTEAGLSFLGLGVQPPTPSWGVVLSDGFSNISQSGWGVIAASVMLMIATVSFTMLGETLRDIVDPRLARMRRVQRA
jgi:peptide/nickel transport system permease protein